MTRLRVDAAALVALLKYLATSAPRSMWMNGYFAVDLLEPNVNQSESFQGSV